MIGRWSLKVALLGLVLVTASAAWAQSTQKLFVITRTTNKNEVHYDAQATKEGKLKPDEPVVAYWIMVEKGGKREKLSFLERKKAYGFSISPEAGGESFRMVIVPYKARPIRVHMKDGKARAEMAIDGKPAYLKKLHIDVTEGIVMPTINFVELFGEDAKTGQPRREKIVPK
jgi:hypothetical protein